MKEVIITDKEGNIFIAVAEHEGMHIGLAPKDFEVRVDGKIIKPIKGANDVRKTIHS